MALRPCLEPGCPALIRPGATRCPAHERERDRARGTTTQRGYGAPHQALRQAWRTRIDSGEPVACWRCGERIDPGSTFDLGHDDSDRSVTRGPEHVACNRATNSHDRRISPRA